MPQAANITIANGANVQKTFTLMTPAAGDGSYAQWRLKEGAIATVFPRLAALARNGNKARKANLKLQVPSSYTDAATGLPKVGSSFDFNVEVTVPDDFPEALRDDAKAFARGFIAHPIIQEMIRDAFAAT